ncbi:MAG: hypothetical protein CBC48_00855 [bacterium TMED88]|nr:hypothetical protein [Deltaproteobacteria bacterium]OUV37286.1 MAG: hypothetical protein CBC48_00855 [bacterium TMED88]
MNRANPVPPLQTSSLLRLQWIAWGVLLVVCGIAVVRAVLIDDEVPFITDAKSGDWITVPWQPTADLIAVLPEKPPSFTFVRRFDSIQPSRETRLTGRALRTLDLEINGHMVKVGPADGAGWKRGFQIDVGRWLRPGRNELRATVRNVHGPPLLTLSLQGPGTETLSTGRDWMVVGPNGASQPAVLAQDSRIHPESRQLPSSRRVAQKLAPVLLGLFAASAVLAWGIMHRSRPRILRHAPTITLLFVSAVWATIYFYKAFRMPLPLGFDAHAHLTYIDYLLREGKPPTADYGFSTYHPPAFHTLVAVISRVTGIGPSSEWAAGLYRIVPMAAGWTTVWLTGRAARRLWPEEALRPSIAIAVAGLLPMNLYMSTYVSNESLHATWVSASLVLATEMILASAWAWRHALLLGVTLGLGLLTKFTSLALAPLIAGLTASRLWIVDRQPVQRMLGVGGALMLISCCIAGWFYARNWILFGDPVVWNLDVPGKPTWWMLPGFRSTNSYLQFGESLSYPFFSGFVSFWDGVYSTLWADGLVAGMIRVSTRHSFWRYDYMTLIPALALPATAAMVGGFFAFVLESFQTPDLRRKLVLSLLTSVLFVLSFSLFFITLRLPFYAQAKAPYVLAGTLPLALCCAQGLGWGTQRIERFAGRGGLVVFWGWAGMLAAVVVLAFAT